MEVILSEWNISTHSKDNDLPERATSAYFDDLMVLVQIMPKSFDTYLDLTMRLFDMLPVGYNNIDVVADTYRDLSLKDPEHEQCGIAERVVVQLPLSNVPQNFS